MSNKYLLDYKLASVEAFRQSIKNMADKAKKDLKEDLEEMKQRILQKHPKSFYQDGVLHIVK